MDNLLQSIKFYEFSVNLPKAIRKLLSDCCVFILDDFQIELKELFNEKIDFVLDYLRDHLNTGYWSQVPDYVRITYSQANVLKVFLLWKCNNDHCTLSNLYNDLMKYIDSALLMGLPITNCPNLLHEMITEVRKYCQKQPNLNLELTLKSDKINLESYNQIDAQIIFIEDCCSLEKFNENYFKPKIPVKLLNCVNHWPALTKWTDINYLLKVAGDRMVPIELGSNYADDEWSQQLMTMKEFIKSYFVNDQQGYLAQHNLFDQIIELKNDIKIPDYCCLKRGQNSIEDVEINAWFGPKGTISPFHYDPKDNLLVQVFGTKQVLLCSPENTQFLYVYDNKLLFNTSRVDPYKPDLEQFPEFQKVKMLKCLLKPTEMLYIPAKWWHHITSLQKSFSVSFWWQ